MKEKIDWYREVLELEPGSRIFFPLAKLLAAEGSIDDAVTTLQQGLVRHPDHVEARLLLVEQLSKQKQSAVAMEREVDGLGSLFSTYPGFWQAWSDHLAQNPSMQDASVAMRFFSETMQGRKINWNDVIEAGFKALFSEKEEHMDASEKHSVAAQSPVAATLTGQADAGAPAVVFSQPGTASAADSDEESSLAIAPQLRVVSAKLTKKMPKEAPVVEAAEPEAEQPVPDSQKVTDEEGEEGVSLRTRTMADILADQGDYASSIEIYQELIGRAKGKERAELQSKLVELHELAAGAYAAAAGQDDAEISSQEEDEPVESKRLVDLLESLAERLEERSR